MKTIEEELRKIRVEIDRLEIEEATLLRVLKAIGDGPNNSDMRPKKRATNVKPLVLEIMKGAGPKGATSFEVAAKVAERRPTVTRDSVSSILSRLKGDKALSYDGERYYDARYAPKDDPAPFRDGLRAVN